MLLLSGESGVVLLCLHETSLWSVFWNHVLTIVWLCARQCSSRCRLLASFPRSAILGSRLTLLLSKVNGPTHLASPRPSPHWMRALKSPPIMGLTPFLHSQTIRWARLSKMVSKSWFVDPVQGR